MKFLASNLAVSALASILLLIIPPGSRAADEPAETGLPPALVDAMHALSDATAPGGEGPEAYTRLLAEGFSRWTMGSAVVNNGTTWARGVADWFDAGWRVVDRRSRVVRVDLWGDTAFIRRVVDESYRGPANEASASRAALAETWVREDGAWKLLRVEALPLDGSPGASD